MRCHADQPLGKEFDSVADPTVFLLQPEALVESLYMPPSYSKHLSIHTPIQSLERSNPPLSEWYPPTGSDLPHGWMQTPQYVLPDHAIKCLAVDCEMVKTSLGQELARITIVNRKLQVIYDSYVQPSAQVLDYATQYGRSSLILL